MTIVYRGEVWGPQDHSGALKPLFKQNVDSKLKSFQGLLGTDFSTLHLR